MKKRYITLIVLGLLLGITFIPGLVIGLPKKVMLSFDVELVDNYQILAQIIPILEKNNAKATFFITGNFAEQNPDIVRYLAENDHEVACHSYSHAVMTSLNADAKKDELKKCIDIINKITYPVLGNTNLGFRAPHHRIDKETMDLLKEMNFSYDSSSIEGLKIFFPKPQIANVPLSSFLLFPIEDYLFVRTLKLPNLFFSIAKMKRAKHINILMHPRYIAGYISQMDDLLRHYSNNKAEFITYSEFLRTSE